MNEEKSNIHCRKKHNKYKFYEDYVVGTTFNTGCEFLFDIEYYNMVKEYCWLENDQGYIITRNPKTGKNLRLHRLILQPEPQQIIDHINNNRADNRNANLRIANKSNNGINRDCNNTNKLGVKGVSKCSNCEKYMARIMVGYKQIYLGIFDTVEAAKNARDEAEKKYFGGFAYDRK